MEQKAFEMALAFQRGEEKGFEYFWNMYYQALLYYAFRIVKDKDAAEDAVSVSFIKIWEQHQNFSHPMVIRSWLYTTSKNQCLNSISQEQNRIRKHHSYAYLTGSDENPIEESIVLREMIREAFEAFEILPTECYKVLTMMFKDNLSAREISNRLNVSLSTIKNQKIRGIQVLRKYIHDGYNGTLKQQQWIKGARNKAREARDEKIIRLINRGISYKNIANAFKISIQMVGAVNKKYKTS